MNINDDENNNDSRSNNSNTSNNDKNKSFSNDNSNKSYEWTLCSTHSTFLKLAFCNMSCCV